MDNNGSGNMTQRKGKTSLARKGMPARGALHMVYNLHQFINIPNPSGKEIRNRISNNLKLSYSRGE